MEPFDLQVDNLVIDTAQTEQFFVANGITDDAKKVAILLMVIGGKAYTLLQNLLAPAKPAEKSFNVLAKVMKDNIWKADRLYLYLHVHKLCVEWGSTNTAGTSMFMVTKVLLKCEVKT